jgi:hypothetical protein
LQGADLLPAFGVDVLLGRRLTLELLFEFSKPFFYAPQRDSPRTVAAFSSRAARFREVYAMIGLQVAVHPSGALDISLGANAGSETKGVMPWDESG